MIGQKSLRAIIDVFPKSQDSDMEKRGVGLTYRKCTLRNTDRTFLRDNRSILVWTYCFCKEILWLYWKVISVGLHCRISKWEILTFNGKFERKQTEFNFSRLRNGGMSHCRPQLLKNSIMPQNLFFFSNWEHMGGMATHGRNRGVKDVGN